MGKEELFAVRGPDDLMALIRFANGELEAAKLRAVLTLWNAALLKDEDCALEERLRIRFEKGVPRSAIVQLHSRRGEWERVAKLHYNKAINWCRVELGADKHE